MFFASFPGIAEPFIKEEKKLRDQGLVIEVEDQPLNSD
jgi:hypothetical protein